MNERASVNPPDMSAFWMPFAANRQLKSAPRLLSSAKGMYHTAYDGRLRWLRLARRLTL